MASIAEVSWLRIAGRTDGFAGNCLMALFVSFEAIVSDPMHLCARAGDRCGADQLRALAMAGAGAAEGACGLCGCIHLPGLPQELLLLFLVLHTSLMLTVIPACAVAGGGAAGGCRGLCGCADVSSAT